MAAIQSGDEVNNLQNVCELTSKALRHAVQAAGALQHSPLLESINTLRHSITIFEASSSFHQTLSKVDKNWIPKGAIEKVLRACCNQRYKENDIEGIFFRLADIDGVLILYLGTRARTALFTKLAALPVDFIEELAAGFKGYQINSVTTAWSDAFDRTRSL